MTSRGRHRLAASVLLAVLGTACGGGGGAGSSERSRAPEVRRSEPPPPDVRPVSHRVPPPVIIDRGADHVAIARSLVLYGRWLESSHPDPALVERAYAPESALARNMAAAVTEMRRVRQRIVELDRARLEFDVLSQRPDVVSFRVTEHLARRELVDAQGRVLQHVGPATEHYLISIMRFASDAPWRLNYAERQGPPIEVQLTVAVGSGELGGGRLAVGIETATGGQAVPVDAQSPSLPRLVHYVWTPLPASFGGSLENLCGASGQAISDPAQLVFGWLYDVVGYTRDGRVISHTNECVAFPDPDDRSTPPPPPAQPAAPTIGDVWRAVALPRPIVGVNPVTRGVTGLETRLWSGGGQIAQVAVTIGGFRITGVARVAEYRCSTDEGYLGATVAPGDASSPAAAHRFAYKGAHSLSVASVWHATVTMTGPGGAASIPIDIDTAVLTVTVDYPVVEVRSRLVA